MKRLKFELIFLAVMLLISMALFYWGTIYKTEYYGIDSNPLFNAVVWIMVLALLLFHKFVLKYGIIASVLLTVLIYFCAHALVGNLFWVVMAKLERLDNKVTPLGWQFNYKWLQLFTISLLMVVFSEIVGLIRRI